MTRSKEPLALVCLAVVLSAACGRPAGQGADQAAADPPASDAVPGAWSSGRIDPKPESATGSAILARQDSPVNGEPACALTVRYADSLEQPVTWRGEPCGALTLRFVNLADLTALGQADKLEAEALDDIADCPDGRVLYIEGAAASAVFPQDSMQQVYRVPLAD